ncbi:hypothetical protein P5P86_16765 [Nocardioides sp. BP30]|uniref:hypothetical protein n=1 Tax=Nocardioides sp. BP30 TaxID=3036374 RepID=UPI0024692715|nr:hypothetical protein [Nocardioides sp. BP30]WGL51602.1 hypothetical protein P5P86_16765 [Nocardioides sp. BP30]
MSSDYDYARMLADLNRRLDEAFPPETFEAIERARECESDTERYQVLRDEFIGDKREGDIQ